MRRLTSVVFVVLILQGSVVFAHHPPPILPEKFELDLNFYAQAQLTMLGSMALDDPCFCGLELFADVSMMGLGLAVGVGFEQMQIDEDDDLHPGGYVLAELQTRPLGTFELDLYEWFDPFIGLGGRLGGVAVDDSAELRATFYVGTGVDVRVLPSDPQLLSLHRHAPIWGRQRSDNGDS